MFLFESIVRLISFLPVPLRVGLAWFLATLMILFGQRRVLILRDNARRCMPHLFPTPHHLSAWRVAFFHAIAILDFLAWLHETPETFARHFHHEGDAIDDSLPTLIYAPHFVGLPLSSRYLAEHHGISFLFSPSKHAWVAQWMTKFYQRLSGGRAHRKTDSILPLARALKHGKHVQLSTDLDVGSKDTLFVPYCGTMVATSPAIPVFAKRFSVPVVGVVCSYAPRPWQEQLRCWWKNLPCPRYRLVIERLPLAWKDSTIITLQTQMHQWLESKIVDNVEQYWWFHRRFKTRPQKESP